MKYTKEHKNSQVNNPLRTETDIVPASPLSITPREVVERGRQAKAFWEAYNQLLRELREEGDFVTFHTKKGEAKELYTKNWVQKLEFIFELSIETEIVSTAGDTDDRQAYIVQARVGRGNRWVVAAGACAPQEFIERGEKARAKAFALQTATTRAINRATARLLALRSISAEELAPEIAVADTPPREITENHVPEPPSSPSSSPSTPKPTSTFAQEKWALVEELVREWGEEKPTELAKQMFRVDRLADLGVPQLREVKKALEGRK